MYLRWAKRKGGETRVYTPTTPYVKWAVSQGLSVKEYIPGYEAGPPVKPAWAEVKTGDMDIALERLKALGLREAAFSVRGPNVYGFLKSESGTHKRLLRDDPDAAAPFHSVVVFVDSVDEEGDPMDALAEITESEQEEARAGKHVEPPPVVRVYQTEGTRFVRDLRTGHETNLVREVLDGSLDEFVLSGLKAEDQSAAWDAVVT